MLDYGGLTAKETFRFDRLINGAFLSPGNRRKDFSMQKIAHDFKMQLIRASAVPLHIRKERARKEKEDEPTFEEMLVNAMVSHATGVDKSHDTEQQASVTKTEAEENTDTVLQAVETINEQNFTLPAVQKTQSNTVSEPNTSLKWHASADELGKSTEVAGTFFQEKRERTQGTYWILIGKNQLPAFFEHLEKGLANGESFEEVIQSWWQVYNKNEEVFNNNMGDGISMVNGGAVYDSFHIDPATGEIKHARPANNMIKGTDQHVNAVWDLAYDLQQFIRYTFFKQEGDDPEEVAQILSDIKARQDNKCTARFNPVFRDDEYVAELEAKLQEALAALDEDEFAEKAKDLMAQFLEALTKHQDKLYEEYKKREGL